MIEALLQAERLLVHGMVEQAEQIYQRTLESDPRNAIAVVGLARVALERADDGLAYRHACAALEIDAQNAAALRLEARLSEVLAARGEPVERPAWLRAKSSTPPLPPQAEQERPPQPSEPETAALARNPSMADHLDRAAERPPEPPASPPEPAAPPPPKAKPAPPRRRRPKGILRRLLGGG